MMRLSWFYETVSDSGRPLKYSSRPCAGIFDLFHFGHAKALEQAKKL